MTELKTKPRIAIPVPHSGDREYAERALPQYEEAVLGAVSYTHLDVYKRQSGILRGNEGIHKTLLSFILKMR